MKKDNLLKKWEMRQEIKNRRIQKSKSEFARMMKLFTDNKYVKFS
jgi:hypothetical protein